MKKQYSKPEIMFETFIMSTNVAAGCEKKVDTQTADMCGIPGSAPGLSFFAVDLSGSDCTVPGTGAEEDDGFCYHNPSTDQNLFNS